MYDKANAYAAKHTPREPSEMADMRRRASSMLAGQGAPDYAAGLSGFEGRPEDAALLRAKAGVAGGQDRSRMMAMGARGVMAGNDFDMRRQALREFMRRSELQDELAKKQALAQALTQMGLGVFSGGANIIGTMAGGPMPTRY
jgi:hypothetical protein